MVVLDDGGQDARRGRGEKRRHRLGTGLVVEALQRRFEVGDLLAEFGMALVGERADAARQVGRVADRLAVAEKTRALLLEARIGLDVGEGQPAALAAEAAEPAPQVQYKTLALLLAVGDDVDAGGALLADHPRHRPGALGRQPRLVDGRAARASRVQLGQRRGARQAAGMSGEDAGGAGMHGRKRHGRGRHGRVRSGVHEGRPMPVQTTSVRSTKAAPTGPESWPRDVAPREAGPLLSYRARAAPNWRRSLGDVNWAMRRGQPKPGSCQRYFIGKMGQIWSFDMSPPFTLRVIREVSPLGLSNEGLAPRPDYD